MIILFHFILLYFFWEVCGKLIIIKPFLLYILIYCFYISTPQ